MRGDINMQPVIGRATPSGKGLTAANVAEIVGQACPEDRYKGRKVLVIIPDGTRTAPVGLMFKTLHKQIGCVARSFDILVALGTHQPMTEEAICRRLEITLEQRRTIFGRVQFFNHQWNHPEALRRVGTIPASDIHELSGGLFSMDVPVQINALLFEYDQVILVGPVFPHEVAGFSGGNKYLFPGVAGPDILNFFHWLGAVVMNVNIIGHKWTPVRKVVDRAGAMVTVPKLCFCMVVERETLAGLYAGTPEQAWDKASDLSAERDIVHMDHAFHTILSCAPAMYDELWTGGKCMYKLEPVLAEGGELIIYAPHISEISLTHGKLIEEVGYHCRDYFLKQWDRFKHYPWGVLAHSTHVRGQGRFEGGVEMPRARVTLATQISSETCRKINLGYRDPAGIHAEEYAGRESEGILLVRKAGEMLYRLREPRTH
jgi:nickel-dependent lactate racemase